MASDYPAPLIFYQMPVAGILQGAPSDWDFSPSWLPSTVTDETRIQNFPQKEIYASFTHYPLEFGKLILKIAYANSFFYLSPDDFTPLAPRYILADDSNVSFLVGCCQELSTRKTGGYSLSTTVLRRNDGSCFLVGNVHLFPHAELPSYQAVIGQVMGDNQLRTCLRKLGVGAAGISFFSGKV